MLDNCEGAINIKLHRYNQQNWTITTTSMPKINGIFFCKPPSPMVGTEGHSSHKKTWLDFTQLHYIFWILAHCDSSQREKSWDNSQASHSWAGQVSILS